MAFDIPGITAPSQTATTNPNALNLPDAKPLSSGGGSCPATADTVKRSDAATNPNAYHDAIARLGGAAALATQRIGAAFPSAVDAVEGAAQGAARAVPAVARLAGPVGAAVSVGTIVAMPANASLYGHESLPGETDKHWLERTAPAAPASSQAASAAGHVAQSVVRADAGKPSVETYPAYTRDPRDAHTAHPVDARNATDSVHVTPAHRLETPTHTGHAAPLIHDSGPHGTPIEHSNAGDLMTPATKYVKGSERPNLSHELNANHGGGPGDWVHKAGASASERAAGYQEETTGKPFGNVYMVDGLEFDGMRSNSDGTKTLLEAKGPGFADKLGKRWFESGAADERQQLLDQNEVAKAHGVRVEWHVAEAKNAEMLQQYARKQGMTNVDIIHSPPTLSR